MLPPKPGQSDVGEATQEEPRVSQSPKVVYRDSRENQVLMRLMMLN